MSTEYHVTFCCWDCGTKATLSSSERIRKWRVQHVKEHERTRTPCRLQVVVQR